VDVLKIVNVVKVVATSGVELNQWLAGEFSDRHNGRTRLNSEY